MVKRIYFFLKNLITWPLYWLRNVDIGRKVFIEKGVFISKSKVGDYTYIGHFSIIDKAEIGNYCSIAAHVQIGGMEHSHWWWSMSTRLSNKGKKNKTYIGNDVWIGSKVSIRQGVKIGDGAVIGSNAVVLEDIPAYSIAVGIPAKVIKRRLTNVDIRKISNSKFWIYNPKFAIQVLKNL